VIGGESVRGVGARRNGRVQLSGRRSVEEVGVKIRAPKPVSRQHEIMLAILDQRRRFSTGSNLAAELGQRVGATGIGNGKTRDIA
jgi:hypothetical protein